MTSDRFSRQSFLGENSQPSIEQAVIGVVGLGGGGGHIVQQSAHVGFLHYRLFDRDSADTSNLNRLVTATEADAEAETLKTELARRRILSIRSEATVDVFPCRWQDNPENLRGCDVVVGCVDGFAERRELEIACRRYLIPLIDIGMDVHIVGDEPPRMGGQVILSMPGALCMTCLGFLNEASLAREANRYGDAGPRPQVVWPNGVLASTAVGLVVDLVTDWTRSMRGPVYLMYDGNSHTVTPHPRLVYHDGSPCTHFPVHQVGRPVFTNL
ncbi:MAG: ThiF family adenylyltransferase [Planctomycetes bacterium]|nr:ThiF family adenylyltransferase [Planctomycetota bacterium]